MKRYWSLTALLSISLVLLVAATGVCEEPAKRPVFKPDLAGRFDGKLTKEAEKRINHEIDLLAEKVKKKISKEDYAKLEVQIDRLIGNLRDWSKDTRWRAEGKDSIGPFFTTYLPQRDKGAEFKFTPAMSKIVGIAGLVSGVKQNGGPGERYEASFRWTEDDGAMVNNWTEEKPVDEEYHAKVTGELRLYVSAEIEEDGRLIKVEAETKKRIFHQEPLVLKASKATIVEVR